MWFAPKGELDDDSVAVLHTPYNLRTIFGSNADAKLISAGVSDAIVDATLAITQQLNMFFALAVSSR